MNGSATTSTYPLTFVITSDFIPPATPKPTLKPTLKPTPTPTTAPTATIEASPSPEPSASPSPSPTLQPTPSPTATPIVAPVQITPGPSASPPAGGGGTGGGSSFVDSIPDFDGVATDATSLGGSALLAVLLLLIGFAAELFNNTVENNYDVISKWFRVGWVGATGNWLRKHSQAGVLLFLFLTALVSSFVDPQFGPNERGVRSEERRVGKECRL